MIGRPQKHFDAETIIYFRRQGYTYAEIARILGTSYCWLRNHGMLDGRTAASYRPGYAMIQEESVK